MYSWLFGIMFNNQPVSNVQLVILVIQQYMELPARVQCTAYYSTIYLTTSCTAGYSAVYSITNQLVIQQYIDYQPEPNVQLVIWQYIQ